MRSVFLFVVGVVSLAFGLQDLSYPNSFSDGDTIYASDFEGNNDSLEALWARNQDSIDIKFMRFSDLESGDSTLGRVQVDTIRGNPDVDSLSGNPVIDSADIGYLVVDTVIGNPYLDSINIGYVLADSIVGNPFVDSADIGYLVADSIVGNPFIDSVDIGYLVADTIRGNPDIDSISGNPVIDSVDIGYMLSDTLVLGTKVGGSPMDGRLFVGDSTVALGLQAQDEPSYLIEGYNQGGTRVFDVSNTGAITGSAADISGLVELGALRFDGSTATTIDSIDVSLAVDSLILKIGGSYYAIPMSAR